MSPSHYQFTLYVAGRTKSIDELIVDLEREMEGLAGDQFTLNVVNVLEMPEMATNANVYVTPTLVRDLPEPVCRIIGNLKDTGKVLFAMNLRDSGGGEQNIIV